MAQSVVTSAHVDALVQPTTNARVTSAHVDALVQPTTNARVTSAHVDALVSVFFGAKPATGSLVLSGRVPVHNFRSGSIRITQAGLNTISQGSSDLRLTQAGLDAISVGSSDLRVTQAAANVLATNDVNLRITQMGLLVLAKGSPIPVVPQPLNLVGSGRTKPVSLRVVNMIYEPTPDGPAADARYGRAGLESVAERGGGPVWAVWQWQGYTFSVSGNSVWCDGTNIGVVPVGEDVRWAVSETEIVMCTNGVPYYVTTTDVTPITDADLPSYVMDVLYADGRFIYLQKGTAKWWYSDVGDARSIDGLSFATADSAPDVLTGGLAMRDNILLFGTQTTEFWYPTDNVEAPFERSSGSRYDKGCVARETIRAADNSAFFLGNDRIVYRVDAAPQRVSTFDVEDSIRRVSDEDISKAFAFVTWYGGHVFYVLSLPGQPTWALDVGQGRWVQWKSWNKPQFRVRSAFGPVLGDLYGGHLMQFNQEVYTDLGEPLERITSAYLPVRSGYLRNFNVMIGTLRGVGNLYGTDGDDPHVEMRYSDTEGKTWADWDATSLGRQGEYEAKAIWTGLSAARAPGRLYEFRCTDPVEFTAYMVKHDEVLP